MNEKYSKKKIIIRSLIFAFSLLLIFGIIALVYFTTGLNKIIKTPEDLKNYILSFGGNSKLIFIVIQILQVTIIPIPNVITVVAGSMIFGPFNSFWMSMVGTLIGSILAFYIGRFLGKKVAYWICGKENVDKYLALLKGRTNTIVFLMFLFPWFPDDVVALVAGLSPMNFKFFLIAVLLGRPWSILMTSYFMGGKIIPFTGYWLIFWAVILILFILFIIYIKRNFKKVLNLLDKFGNIFEKKEKKNE